MKKLLRSIVSSCLVLIVPKTPVPTEALSCDGRGKCAQEPRASKVSVVFESSSVKYPSNAFPSLQV